MRREGIERERIKKVEMQMQQSKGVDEAFENHQTRERRVNDSCKTGQVLGGSGCDS